jgi:hypothetical protein
LERKLTCWLSFVGGAEPQSERRHTRSSEAYTIGRRTA